MDVSADKTRVLLVSAHFGDYLPNLTYIKQNLPDWISLDCAFINNGNMAPRDTMMHPRLRAKMPKMCAWKMWPGYDYYIWLDSSLYLSHENAVEWLVSECTGHDMAIFKHEYRSCVEEELKYMEVEMSQGNKYLLERYEHEPMRQQVEMYLVDPDFSDNILYTGGAFVYKNNPVMQAVMVNWYQHNCMYTIQDQLSLPYILSKLGAKVKVLDYHVMGNLYITYRLQKLGRGDVYDE
jgi:hypothetical protein